MREQGKVIEDAAELESLAVCEEQPVREAVAKLRSAFAIVTANYDIYYHVPDKAATGVVEFSQLVRKVRALGPGKEIPISRTVYDSLKARPEDKDSKLERSRQANERVEELLESAIRARATDIHINVFGETRVHYRIHGVLTLRQRLPAKIGQEIVSSLFAHYAGTSYSEREEARDGKFYFPASDGASYMVRLSKVAMVDAGLTCKMRLRRTDDKVDLGTAGYSDGQLAAFKSMMARGMGLLVITGAVNSGKSTTMTSLLASIPKHYAVLEISDTVEVRLDGVCHVEMPADGDNLEQRIQAIQDAVVRQDSDYLAIGEMRNRMTAAQAEVMGLLGKFVISTGHAADVVSFYQRMVGEHDFGMSPKTVLSPKFMVGLVSQSLVEMICADCARAEPGQEAAERAALGSPAEVAAHYRAGLGSEAVRYHNPAGCDSCDGTGLAGRTVVAEVLPFDDELRAILGAGEFGRVRDWMRERGVESKYEHAAGKVRRGQVDPLHVARRIDPLGPETLPHGWCNHQETVQLTRAAG